METGNRRFLTIPVIGVDFQHSTDMQQMWAGVKTWYDEGQQWWLTDAGAEKIAEIITVRVRAARISTSSRCRRITRRNRA
jgi:predicted P-loop ATPase